MTYKFSVSMPTDLKNVKSVIKTNSQVEKSKVQSLYFALPLSSPDKTGFEQLRTCSDKIERLEDYQPLIECIKENDLDFIYLLNSPKPFLFESDFLKHQLEQLDTLINKLKKMGCNKYRVCNPQLIAYLSKNYPELELYASTSLEYRSVKQFSNFLELYPNIKEIIPQVDYNKDFRFLKNLRKLYPNVKIELIVNEGCMYACPLRYSHNLSFRYGTSHGNINDDISMRYFINTCKEHCMEHIYDTVVNKNIIYPWEIEEYKDLGINNFKIVGRDINYQVDDINYVLLYLKGVDDYKNIKDKPLIYFNYYLLSSEIPYTVDQMRKYLPSIKHFKKNGYLCSSICGIECNYCKKCAEKLAKAYSL